MFQKLLIANRGEIACRVIKTARQMGIRTVAVYSEADRDALHVLQADEAVCAGPAESARSYLNVESIIDACRQTGAEAVHPGYGFLSENAQFAAQLVKAGIVFIGPNAHAIESLGDKIRSKQLAQQAGVNTIRGFDGVVRDVEHAVQVARQIGYPVMLKASAGGGGKGMRLARNDEECREGFARATNEARGAFGDERLLLERFIESPRHIEIQVLGDRFGNVVHLGERECSLQRRHQKVIEEAPSPFLDAATRSAMGAQAVALARAVGYQSAGTVEFLVDAERNFYFLEMNTRLQVEHPVTECVTGLDLVKLMIRIAAGEKLPFTQGDVQLNGWSIEARVYAEDPFRNFLPSCGRLVYYRPPAESDGVRIDSGVYEGADVPLHYDPLMAKLITHGATREAARTQMRDALNAFYIRGVSHNLSFLSALVDHKRFRDGRLSTDLIAEEYPDGFQAPCIAEDELPLWISVAAAIHRRHADRAAQVSGQMPGYERIVPDDWVVVAGDDRYPVTVRAIDGGHEVVFAEATHCVLSDWQFGQPMFRGYFNGKSICLQVERRGLGYRLYHQGATLDVLVLTARAAELLSTMPLKKTVDTGKFLLSPMPGLLTQLLVSAGEDIKQGQQLAVVEAMKMENALYAPRDAKVRQTLASVGDHLTVDQQILEFE